MSAMLEKVVKYASLLVAFGLLVVLFRDAWSSIFSPWPHRIGEGMMAWMASEISAGRSPYGDILAIPSVYACYGPLPSLAAAVASAFIPGDASAEHIVWAGRLLNFAAWCTASVSVVAIVRPKSVHPAVAACFFLGVASPFWAFWTFRTDSFVAALEALILLSLVRLPSRSLIWALGVLAPALALTKIPAALDILPLVLLSSCIRGHPLDAELRRVAPGLLVGLGSALLAIVLANAASGGWMVDNIIFTQLSSGRTTGAIFSSCVDFALYGRQSTVLWVGVLAACFFRSRVSLLALALSLLTCGALATKDGADNNYYLPFLFMSTVVAVRELDRAGRLAWAALILPLTVLPLSGSLHRDSQSEIATKTGGYESVLAVHRDPLILSDDPYYNLMAGTRPLATDLFQLSRVLSSSGTSSAPLVAAASSAWGEEFIWVILGRSVDRDSPLVAGLPHANHQGAVHISDLRPLVSTAPPSTQKNDSLLPLYLSKLCVLAFFLVIAAFLPLPSTSTSKSSSPPTR